MSLNAAFKALLDPRFEAQAEILNAIMVKVERMEASLRRLDEELFPPVTTNPLIDDEAEAEPETESSPKRARVVSESESSDDEPEYTNVKRCFIRDGRVYFELVNEQSDTKDVPAEDVKKDYAELFRKFLAHANTQCMVEYIRYCADKKRGRVVSVRPKFIPNKNETGRACKFHDTHHPEEDFDAPEDESCRVQIKEGTF